MTNIFRTFVALLLVLTGFTIALPQGIRIETKKAAVPPLPQHAVKRLILRSGDNAQIGHVLRSNDTISISLPDRKPVILPYHLDPIVSYDGSTIIQFGDKRLLDLPKHLDVYWIDSNGREKAGLVNRYGGDARLNLSSDGFTAIGGALFDKPREKTVGLYSPGGEKVWETGIARTRRVAQLFAARHGSAVVVLTTDAEKNLDRHQLDIYDKSGKYQSAIKDLGIIQKVVLVGDETKFFFQGRECYGMVDVTAGRVLWKNAGQVTLVSPYGASLSPDGKSLFLAVVPAGAKRTGVYQWKFTIIDASNGKEIGSHVLTDQYPSTWERIFESVGDDAVTLIAGGERITISVASEKGGPK